MVQDANGRFFGMGYHELTELDLVAQTKTRIQETNVPDISWAMGIAYDTTRQRLALATLGGEGILYTVDTADDSWSVMTSLENIDLTAIAYHESLDRYFAVGHRFLGSELYEFDAHDGSLVQSRPLEIPTLDGHGLFDRTNQLFAVDDKLAFLQFPDDAVPVIHAIDPRTGGALRVVPEPSSLLVLLFSGLVCSSRWPLRKM